MLHFACAQVVNALLTQLDLLRKHNNVVILTTSNISEAIDLAFVDRADIKQYIGLPTTPAVYRILRTCLEELERVGIIRDKEKPALVPFQQLLKLIKLKNGSENGLAGDDNHADLRIGQSLLRVAASCEVLNIICSIFFF
ncbi:thyroid hormone receptor interactor [Reticulomyxa filosa]|uniref:Thyroid hormone receptor interactor n=1 Tax=Reticulomyxa filosa TaxID=46433 RepID=X6P5N8_RETFI|nr:thyroid hormone receptor interactor [Reticulomyxa filosa]|eukprot:ETO33855.1 thyroid hormone receptor interactor [Reticulomyxa filosa]